MSPIAVALLTLGTLLAPRQDALTIGFLDVGQGTATIVRSPEGKVALVDGGRSSEPVARALQSLGVDTIDLVVATHADADHIEGLEWVLRHTTVRYFLDNGMPHTTAAYRRLMQGVEESDAVYLAATDRRITIGSVTMRVLPPPVDADDQNDASVGLLIEYGDFRALLVGDAERQELAHFLDLGVPHVSVLEASHHGALNGVTPAWIAATSPRAVLISVGRHNAYGHPDPIALRYYATKGRVVFRTDWYGTVWVSAARDGGFTVETERTPPGDALRRTFEPEVRP